MATSFFASLGLLALNILTPGASFVLTISNAMNHGRRSGLFVAFGLVTVDTLFAAAATAGLAALVGQNVLLVKGFCLLGGLWFIYGGLRLMLKHKAKQLPQVADRTAGALRAVIAYRRGFIAGALNVRTIIFFASIFLAARFAKPSLYEAVVLVVGVACVSALTRSNIVLVFTIESVVRFCTQQRRSVDAVSGGALTAFGLQLAVPAAEVLAARVLAV